MVKVGKEFNLQGITAYRHHRCAEDDLGLIILLFNFFCVAWPCPARLHFLSFTVQVLIVGSASLNY